MTRADPDEPDRPDAAPDAKPSPPRQLRRVRRYRDDERADGQRGRPPADRDEVWGEGDTSNDARLRREVPPHHGG